MRLSTKGRYALEALVLLGYRGESESSVSIKSICSDTDMSEGYLEQLFRELKKSSILTSKKGKYGGYQLAKEPSKISVGEIFRSVEGSLAPVHCIESKTCSRADKCITKDLWTDIYDEITDVVDNITLSRLVSDYRDTLARSGSL